MASTRSDTHETFPEALERLMRAEFNPQPHSELYQYTPIPPSAQIIRLLHLMPGQFSSPLAGDLTFTPLSSPKSYAALSYSWGASHAKPHVLHLQSSTVLPITVSLDTALRYLRDEARTRTLWVDAVCIDQRDLAERAEQVQLMGRVYSSADEVLCWLGKDNERGDGSRALDLLRRLGRVSFRGVPKGLVPEELMRAAGLPGPSHDAWEPIVWLYNLPWFHRLWVVQEFVLGRKVRLICGKESVDWTVVDLGNEKVAMHGILCCVLLNMRVPTRRCSRAMDACTAFVGMTALRKWKSPADYFYHVANRLVVGDLLWEDLDAQFEKTKWGFMEKFLNLYKGIRESPWRRELEIGLVSHYRGISTGKNSGVTKLNPRVPIVGLFSMLGCMGTTDPWDKLFALLALTAEGEDMFFKPSYTETVESVYTRFARRLITLEADDNTKARGLLTLLSAGLITRPSDPTLNLPSWVFDWCSYNRNPFCVIVLGEEKLKHYCAGGSMLSIAFGTDASCALHIKGGFVDSVANIVTISSTANKRHFEDSKINPGDINQLPRTDVSSRSDPEAGSIGSTDWHRYLAAAEDLILNRTTTPLRKRPNEEPLAVLWCTLVANNNLKRALLTAGSTCKHDYLYFPQHLMMVKDTSSPAAIESGCIDSFELWYKIFFSLCFPYAICDTSTGFIGLIPRCASSGDEIHIIRGACTPVVLRRTGRSDNAYQLLGPCYVHGIMQGEFLRDEMWNEKLICLE